jgi:hypothetical protein
MLGASRPRLIRQLIFESLILSLLGCAGGVWLASQAIGLLAVYGPAKIPRLKDAAPDATVLGLAIAASVVTAFVFGLVPAFPPRRHLRVTCSKTAAPEASRAAPRRGCINILAISETAITLALLVAAGLSLAASSGWCRPIRLRSARRLCREHRAAAREVHHAGGARGVFRRSDRPLVAATADSPGTR